MYGATMLPSNIGGYVLVSVTTFVIAVVVTVACMKWHEKEKHKEEEMMKQELLKKLSIMVAVSATLVTGLAVNAAAANLDGNTQFTYSAYEFIGGSYYSPTDDYMKGVIQLRDGSQESYYFLDGAYFRDYFGKHCEYTTVTHYPMWMICPWEVEKVGVAHVQRGSFANTVTVDIHKVTVSGPDYSYTSEGNNFVELKNAASWTSADFRRVVSATNIESSMGGTTYWFPDASPNTGILTKRLDSTITDQYGTYDFRNVYVHNGDGEAPDKPTMYFSVSGIDGNGGTVSAETLTQQNLISFHQEDFSWTVEDQVALHHYMKENNIYQLDITSNLVFQSKYDHYRAFSSTHSIIRTGFEIQSVVVAGHGRNTVDGVDYYNEDTLVEGKKIELRAQVKSGGNMTHYSASEMAASLVTDIQNNPDKVQLDYDGAGTLPTIQVNPTDVDSQENDLVLIFDIPEDYPGCGYGIQLHMNGLVGSDGTDDFYQFTNQNRDYTSPILSNYQVDTKGGSATVNGDLQHWASSHNFGITFPENPYTNGDERYFSMSITDGTNTPSISSNVAPNKAFYASNYTYQLSLTGLGERKYELLVSADDRAGNKGQSSTEIWLDNLAPRVEVTTQERVEAGDKTKQQTFQFDITDASDTGNVFYCFVKKGQLVPQQPNVVSQPSTGVIDSELSRWYLVEQGDATTTAMITAERDELVDATLYWYSTDDAGNSSYIQNHGYGTQPIYLDNTQADATLVVGSYSVPQQNYDLSFTEMSQGAKVEYRWTMGSISTAWTNYATNPNVGQSEWGNITLDGNCTLQYRVTSLTGQTAPVQSRNFTFDNSKPSLSVALNDTTIGTQKKVTITSSDLSLVSTLSYVLVNTDGSALDDASPVTEHNIRMESITKKVVLSPEKTGAYRVKVIATDIYGNQSTAYSYPFSSRVNAPTATGELMDMDNMIATDEQYTVALTLTEDVENSADFSKNQRLKYQVSSDGINYGENWITGTTMSVEGDQLVGTAYLDTPVMLSSGANTIYIRAVVTHDDEGEIPAQRIAYLTPIHLTLDRTAPRALVSYPDTEPTKDATTVIVELSDDISSGDDLTLSCSEDYVEISETVTENPYTGGRVFTLTIEKNGTYPVIASDQAENKADISLVVDYIDQSPPVAEISQHGTVSSGERTDYSANVTMTDAVSSTVRFAVTPNSTEEQVQLQTSWDSSNGCYVVTAQGASGDYDLIVYAEDSVGNVLEETLDSFTLVDTHAELTDWYITPEKALEIAQIKMTFNVPVVLIAADQVHIDDSMDEDSVNSLMRHLTSSSGYRTNQTFAITEVGTYDFYIVDELGRYKEISVSVDETNVQFGQGETVADAMFAQSVYDNTAGAWIFEELQNPYVLGYIASDDSVLPANYYVVLTTESGTHDVIIDAPDGAGESVQVTAEPDEDTQTPNQPDNGAQQEVDSMNDVQSAIQTVETIRAPNQYIVLEEGGHEGFDEPDYYLSQGVELGGNHGNDYIYTSKLTKAVMKADIFTPMKERSIAYTLYTWDENEQVYIETPSVYVLQLADITEPVIHLTKSTEEPTIGQLMASATIYDPDTAISSGSTVVERSGVDKLYLEVYFYGDAGDEDGFGAKFIFDEDDLNGAVAWTPGVEAPVNQMTIDENDNLCINGEKITVTGDDGYTKTYDARDFLLYLNEGTGEIVFQLSVVNRCSLNVNAQNIHGLTQTDGIDLQNSFNDPIVLNEDFVIKYYADESKQTEVNPDDYYGRVLAVVELPQDEYTEPNPREIYIANNGGNFEKWLTPSEQQFTFKLTDMYGYQLQQQVFFGKFDVKAPNVSWKLSNSAQTKENVTLYITAADPNLSDIVSGSGVDTVTVALVGGNTTEASLNGDRYEEELTENGSYIITVTDKAGNATQTKIVVNNIDRTPPTATVKFNCDPDSLTKNDVLAQLTFHEKGAMLTDVQAGAEMNRDDFSWDAATAVIRFKANGTVTAYFEDAVGNRSSRAVTVSNISNTPPNLKPVVDASQYPVTVHFEQIMQGNTPVDGDGEELPYSATAKDIFTFNGESYPGYWQTELNRYLQTLTVLYQGQAKSVQYPLWKDEDTLAVEDGKVKAGYSSYQFQENGTYGFLIYDEAGNVQEVTAHVTGIEADNPTVTKISWTYEYYEKQLDGSWTLTGTKTETYTAGDEIGYIIADDIHQTTNQTVEVTVITDQNTTWVGDLTGAEGATAHSKTYTENGTFQFNLENNAGRTDSYQVGVYLIDTTAPQIISKETGDTLPDLVFYENSKITGYVPFTKDALNDYKAIDRQPGKASVNYTDDVTYVITDAQGNVTDLANIIYDKNKPYTVTYTVFDQAGNQAEISRILTFVGIWDCIALINGQLPDSDGSLAVDTDDITIHMMNSDGSVFGRYAPGVHTMGQMKAMTAGQGVKLLAANHDSFTLSNLAEGWYTFYLQTSTADYFTIHLYINH